MYSCSILFLSPIPGKKVISKLHTCKLANSRLSLQVLGGFHSRNSHLQVPHLQVFSGGTYSSTELTSGFQCRFLSPSRFRLKFMTPKGGLRKECPSTCSDLALHDDVMRTQTHTHTQTLAQAGKIHVDIQY